MVSAVVVVIVIDYFRLAVIEVKKNGQKCRLRRLHVEFLEKGLSDDHQISEFWSLNSVGFDWSEEQWFTALYWTASALFRCRWWKSLYGVTKQIATGGSHLLKSVPFTVGHIDNSLSYVTQFGFVTFTSSNTTSRLCRSASSQMLTNEN